MNCFSYQFSSSMDVVDVDCGINKPFAACNCAHEEIEAGDFECNICFDACQDPVVTLCGHLYCWPCLYQWLQVHFYSHECPVCKAIIEEEKLVPIYGRGKGSSNPKPQPCSDLSIPKRPVGQRPPTAPPVEIHYFRQEEPAPTGSARLSAFLGILAAIFSAPGNGMHDTSVYGGRITSGIPYFFPISFHGGGYGQGSNRLDEKRFFVKTFFLFLGILVLAQMMF